MSDMNFHPILVHFPIALLSIYSLLEMVRFKRFLALPSFFHLKAFLVIVGTLMAGPTILTGKIIESQFADQAKLVELHSYMAYVAIGLYALLAVGYILNLLKVNLRFISLLSKPILQIPVSLIAFGLLLTTGALGGIIAFGPNTDPFAQVLHNFLKVFNLI